MKLSAPWPAREQTQISCLAAMDEPLIKVEVNAVRLQQAVLCADCDVITDSPHNICLVCGSRSLLPLARVLGEDVLSRYRHKTQESITPAMRVPCLC